MSSKHDPSSYPIVFQIVDGSVMVSQPDFDINIYKGNFNDMRNAKQIGDMILDILRETMVRYSERFSKDPASIPVPSNAKGAVTKLRNKPLRLYEAAAFLGISEDALRRASNDRKVKVKLTPGGHRRFRAVDLEEFKKTLERDL